MADWAGIDNFLPPDSEARLARAWAWTVWPHLMSGSKMKAFSPTTRSGYWLTTWTSGSPRSPPLRGFPEVDKGKNSRPVTLDDGSVLSVALTGNPRMGGRVWLGEDDAHDAVVETVEAADGTG
jgi:hypothetical protein